MAAAKLEKLGFLEHAFIFLSLVVDLSRKNDAQGRLFCVKDRRFRSLVSSRRDLQDVSQGIERIEESVPQGHGTLAAYCCE